MNPWLQKYLCKGPVWSWCWCTFPASSFWTWSGQRCSTWLLFSIPYWRARFYLKCCTQWAMRLCRKSAFKRLATVHQTFLSPLSFAWAQATYPAKLEQQAVEEEAEYPPVARRLMARRQSVRLRVVTQPTIEQGLVESSMISPSELLDLLVPPGCRLEIVRSRGRMEASQSFSAQVGSPIGGPGFAVLTACWLLRFQPPASWCLTISPFASLLWSSRTNFLSFGSARLRRSL